MHTNNFLRNSYECLFFLYVSLSVMSTFDPMAHDRVEEMCIQFARKRTSSCYEREDSFQIKDNYENGCVLSGDGRTAKQPS